jgi:chlorobactene glucosyltransferase
VPPIWLLAALPWLIAPIALAWRSRRDAPIATTVATGDELVSIIVPARNEARNIEPCMRSILGTTWANFELIVVNDHSTDGTGEIARRAALGDARVRVIDAPDLPQGWFGKQWACHQGQLVAGGRKLLFTDADTRHGPEIVGRALQSMKERHADMLSAMPTQVYGTFWERLLMPMVIAIIVARYGDVEEMNKSTNPLNKIANGQFILISREWYDRIGGHAGVRGNVAEDLRMAQEVCRAGGSMQLVDGRGFISTRMYEGLRELMRGWGKNIYAAGRDTLPFGPLGQAIVRAITPLPPLGHVIPFVLGAAASVGLLPLSVLWWALTCYLAWVAFWAAVYIEHDVPLWYSLLHPVANVIMFVLVAGAAWRGTKVEWKGRQYISRHA